MRTYVRMTDWDWEAIRRFYEDGHTIRETCDQFNLTARAWRLAVADGRVPAPEVPLITPSEKRALIERMFRDGYTQAMIGIELGLSKATVSYHARRLGRPVHDEFARRYDWEAVQRAHNAGMRALECCKHFGFTKATWSKAVATGRIKPRSHLIPLEMLLVKGRRTNRSHLKKRLIHAGLKENRCEICGVTTWMGKQVNMQLHHINGDGSDNRLENIQFLCGNCHSQTDTYGGRNGHRRPDRHLKLVEPPFDEEDLEGSQEVA
jgi:5-methylcytosine-specific restriction endonuclease McrA